MTKVSSGENSKTATNESNGSRVGAISDNPSPHISLIKLDETNYLAWSHSCLLFIKARRMYDTSQKKVMPATNDLLLNRWNSENSLVMSGHINSMGPSIARGYLLLDSASKICSAANQIYSQLGNDAWIYDCSSIFCKTQQFMARVVFLSIFSSLLSK